MSKVRSERTIGIILPGYKPSDLDWWARSGPLVRLHQRFLLVQGLKKWKRVSRGDGDWELAIRNPYQLRWDRFRRTTTSGQSSPVQGCRASTSSPNHATYCNWDLEAPRQQTVINIGQSVCRSDAIYKASNIQHLPVQVFLYSFEKYR